MQIRNPTYNKYGSIDCEIEHSDFGWIPHTATEDDPETLQVYARIINGEAGEIAPYVEPVIPKDELARTARERRNKMLSETDYKMMPDYPIDETLREAYGVYRQALRDAPQQRGFPENIDWPEKPDGNR